MNTRLTTKVYLCIALGVHVGAIAVAVFSVNAAAAYWSHFLEGQPYPSLFLFVVAMSPMLRWVSVVVVLAGIFAAFKASASWALHYLACVVAITVGILCVTAFGLSLPMYAVAHFLDQQGENQRMLRGWTGDIPPRFAFITTNTTLQQVIDKVGMYDRERGSGIARYEYDLPDGSAVLISPEWPFTPTNKIEGIAFFHRKNEIKLYP